jgi:hypothetical protein
VVKFFIQLLLIVLVEPDSLLFSVRQRQNTVTSKEVATQYKSIGLENVWVSACIASHLVLLTLKSRSSLKAKHKEIVKRTKPLKGSDFSTSNCGVTKDGLKQISKLRSGGVVEIEEICGAEFCKSVKRSAMFQ